VGRWSERRLMGEVAAGRREACAELVHRHYEGVYRFLLHLARDPDLAADLTQETFATAWAKADQFRGDASPATWLHRIAYAKFIDARRGRSRAAMLVARLGRSHREAEEVDPLGGLLADESARRLYEAVQALEDEADRAAVVLHYWQGLSFRAMAEVLGEPVGTVKWRVSRALGRLRARLEAGEDHEHESQAGAGGVVACLAAAAGAGGPGVPAPGRHPRG
jgi:RNA polymerase sigma-70 factor, ECF subfamily